MSRRVPIRDETDRYVLFLDETAEAYRNQDGSRQSRVDTIVQKFLTEDSPESALEDEDKFTRPLRQIKDRNGNIRGLGVWCQGTGFDLFVLQALFPESRKEEFYRKEGLFLPKATDLKDRYGGADKTRIEEKRDEWDADPDLILRVRTG